MGLTLAGAFLGLAFLGLWRGRIRTAAVCGVVSALLTAAGLAIPERLGPLFRTWMRVGHLMSKVTTPILLGVVYFLVLTPIGLFLRVRKPSPSDPATRWLTRPQETRQRRDLEHQF